MDLVPLSQRAKGKIGVDLNDAVDPIDKSSLADHATHINDFQDPLDPAWFIAGTRNTQSHA